MTDLSVHEFPQNPDESKSESSGYKHLLRVNFDRQVTPSIDESLSRVPSRIMMQLFSFTLVFRSELKIIETGEKLKEMYPAGTFIG